MGHVFRNDVRDDPSLPLSLKYVCFCHSKVCQRA